MTILSKKGISSVSVFPNFLALASVGLSTFFNAGLLSGYYLIKFAPFNILRYDL